jgi:hypothetical protein
MDNVKLAEEAEKQLTREKHFVDNRHPDYKDYASEWKFLYESYRGGPYYLADEHLFKFDRETDSKYKDRKKRAVRLNHTKAIVNTLAGFLTKSKPDRKIERVPSQLNEFWDSCNQKGHHINKFMASVAKKLEIFGVMYVVVDKPGYKARTAYEEKKLNLNPYLYTINPLNLLDIHYSSGKIEYALVRETTRGKLDPFKHRKNNKHIERYRLWYLDGENGGKVSWKVYQLNPENNKIEEVLELAGTAEGITRIPIVQIKRNDEDSTEFVSSSPVQEIAYLDRHIYNNNSMLDNIIVDQSFSILAVHSDSINDENWEKWKGKMSTESTIPFDTVPPTFIAPDASQATMISDRIKDESNMIYSLAHILDNLAPSGDAVQGQQSGKSKQFDFEKLNSFLADEAKVLEEAEYEIASLVLEWTGNKFEMDNDVIIWPQSFDTKQLKDHLDEMFLIHMHNLSGKLNKYISKQIVNLAFPDMDEEIRKEIIGDIDSQPDEPMDGDHNLLEDDEEDGNANG